VMPWKSASRRPIAFFRRPTVGALCSAISTSRGDDHGWM
jgi:hypothetical protein